mgnify:CR=1 FL=1
MLVLKQGLFELFVFFSNELLILLAFHFLLIGFLLLAAN